MREVEGPKPVPEADVVEGLRAPRETAAAAALEGEPGLIGQDAARRAFLDSMAEGRPHHAWLLRGPRGVGKAGLAALLAIDVLGGPDAGPERAQAARHVGADAHPRLITLRRGWNDKTERHRAGVSVDDARRLTAFLSLSASDGGWRAAIVDAADALNREAANALLKVIEEPPARTVIFLLSHGEKPPLATLVSRCRRLTCPGLSAAEAMAALAAAAVPPPLDENGEPERPPFDLAAAEKLAPLAAVDGAGADMRVSPGALARLTQAGGDRVYAELLGVLGGLPALDLGRLERLTGSVGRAGAAAMKFEAAGRLLPLALERLARAGAIGAEAAALRPDEARVAGRLAVDLRAARLLAEGAAMARALLAEQAELNLDPGRTLLDIFKRLEEELSRARPGSAA